MHFINTYTPFMEAYNINDDNYVVIESKPEGYKSMRRVTPEQLAAISSDVSPTLGLLLEEGSVGSMDFTSKDSKGHLRNYRCYASLPDGIQFNGEDFLLECDGPELTLYSADGDFVCSFDVIDYVDFWDNLKPIVNFHAIAEEIIEGIYQWANSPEAVDVTF